MLLLTSFVKQDRKRGGNALSPLMTVLLDELTKNLANKEIQRDELKTAKDGNKKSYQELCRKYGCTIDECIDIIKAIRNELIVCESLISQGHTGAWAIRQADNILHRVYSPDFKGKVLDIVAIPNSLNDSSYQWILGDCKFEIKTNAMNLFGDVANFNERIAEKFNDIQSVLDGDGETYDRCRLVIVCRSAWSNATRALSNLKLGNTKPPIVRGDYKVVSSETLPYFLLGSQQT